MTWMIEYLPEARDDLAQLDGSQRARVAKAIAKVSSNPLPTEEGGYGKPLGNKRTFRLSGLLKIKLKADGIRIIYRLVTEGSIMKIVIIGMRSDNDVYREAAKRREAHSL